MSATIVTGEVRLSYVSVFTPKVPKNGGDPKYSVTILVPKTDIATKQAIDLAIQQTLQEAVVTTFGGQMPATPATPIYDGDSVRPSGEMFSEECRGHWVMTAKSNTKPEVVDANVQPILSPTAVYSGCYGRVSIRFFAYSQKGNKGVGCGLGNVQKLRDGEPLAGGTTAKQDFGTPIPQAQQQMPSYGASVPQPQQPMPYGQPVPQMQQPMPYGQPAQQAYPQPPINNANNGFGFLGM